METGLVSLCLQNFVASSFAWCCSLPRPLASKTAAAGQPMSWSLLKFVQLAVRQADLKRYSVMAQSSGRAPEKMPSAFSHYSLSYKETSQILPTSAKIFLDKTIRYLFPLYSDLIKGPECRSSLPPNRHPSINHQADSDFCLLLQVWSSAQLHREHLGT